MNMAESSAARLQMLINRAQRLNTEAARPQVVENQDDDDFLSGFQHFRRSHESRRAGSSRKKKKPMYSFKVTCLDSPEYQTINPTIVKAMNEKQLGYRPIKIERSATINKLTEKVMSIFKFTCAFKYMKAVRNTINICELKELQVTSTKDVKSKIGRSNLYILPAEKIGQSSPEESSDESGSSLPNPHLDAIPQRRSRLCHRNNVRTSLV
ncbi:uncharacterized protein LOC127708469 [Mytilus californianus]|uniref:uncharacterized protein LOC127708469 n=1 Tax=Mytilus californianus TaxID=6549 RepID=UPI002246E755|nr:uncharacterized protein LOC127708469 [Mytilus californianus]